MAQPRCTQFDPANPPWIHCISRCVRRAFLCGQDHEGRDLGHRKLWIESRLRLLAETAACDVAAYAVMTNHVHVVLKMQPERAAGWSAREVVRRYVTIWPRDAGAGAGAGEDGSPQLPSEAELATICADAARVATWRRRLGDLGWTMRALKEHLARRANKEDGCSGAFWEGRYKSVPLLDQAALVACMAYVDLNPIRARMTDRPESSRFTGAYERIRARKVIRAAAALRRRGKSAEATALLREKGLDGRVHDPDRACWLTPIVCCLDRGSPLSLDDYLTLVDRTGRVIKAGKRGAIPPDLLPILKRLDIDLDRWLGCMGGWQQFLGAAVGRAAARLAEASRRGLRWIQNRCRLFGAAESPHLLRE